VITDAKPSIAARVASRSWSASHCSIEPSTKVANILASVGRGWSGLLYTGWLRAKRPRVYLELASDSHVNHDYGHDRVDPLVHPQVSTRGVS
jgi:hypothetical protein